MPELPEVETVRRGLAPAMEDARFDEVVTHRAGLRWPFPKDFYIGVATSPALSINSSSMP